MIKKSKNQQQLFINKLTGLFVSEAPPPMYDLSLSAET